MRHMHRYIDHYHRQALASCNNAVSPDPAAAGSPTRPGTLLQGALLCYPIPQRAAASSSLAGCNCGMRGYKLPMLSIHRRHRRRGAAAGKAVGPGAAESCCHRRA